MPGLRPSGYEAYPCYMFDSNTEMRTYRHRTVVEVPFAGQLRPFFSKRCLWLHPRLPPVPTSVDVALDGAYGLALGMNVTDGPVVSVEAAVLYRLMQERARGHTEVPPTHSAAQTFTCGTANGWVGFITGQFFQYRSGAIPEVAEAVLADRYAHLRGSRATQAIDNVAGILHDNGWCGAPDITVWNELDTRLLLFEVKTPTDRLSKAQKSVLSAAREYAECTVVWVV